MTCDFHRNITARLSSGDRTQEPLILRKVYRRFGSCTIGYELLVGKHLRGGGDR
jgi:hypothetical protein